MSHLEQLQHFCQGHGVDAAITGHYVAVRIPVVSKRGNTFYMTYPVMTLRDAKKVLGY